MTKVCLVKAMVFPVVMYICESWTIKEAECWRIDALELQFWRRLMDSKEIKPDNLKGNQLWIFTERTHTEAPLLWPPDAKSCLIGKDPDAGKDWGQEEKGMPEDEMVGCIINSVNMTLSKLWEIVKDRGAWRAAVHGVAKCWTWLSYWTTTAKITVNHWGGGWILYNSVLYQAGWLFLQMLFYLRDLPIVLLRGLLGGGESFFNCLILHSYFILSRGKTNSLSKAWCAFRKA